jgi:hypothetical protein
VFTFNWIAENTGGVAPDNYEVRLVVWFHLFKSCLNGFPALWHLQIVSVSAPATGLELFSKAELPRTWPEGKYRVDVLAGNTCLVVWLSGCRVRVPVPVMRLGWMTVMQAVN